MFVTETGVQQHSGIDEQLDPYDLGIKFENVLVITKQKRDQHIYWLWCMNDSRVWDEDSCNELIFSEEDMSVIMNAWKAEWDFWSEWLDGWKSTYANFSTMLAQLVDSEPLVHLFVKYPVCTTRDPARLLRGLAHGMAAYKDSAEHHDARRNSHLPGRRNMIAKLGCSYTSEELDNEIATPQQDPPPAPFHGIAEGVAQTMRKLQGQ